MFDCGVPYKTLKPHLYKCDSLLITHEHKDHLNEATLRSVMEDFPNIQVLSTYKVSRINPGVIPLNLDYLPYVLGDSLLWAVEVPHDTLCYAYVVQHRKGMFLYSTDLNSTETLTEACEVRGWRFNAVFLEANYDPVKLSMMGYEWRGRYNPYYDSTNRHLSKDESLLFYSRFKREGGEYIELHKSGRFY